MPPDAPARFFQITVATDGSIRVTREPGAQKLANSLVDKDDLQRRTTDVLVRMLREGRLKSREEFQILGENLHKILLDNPIGEAVKDAFGEYPQFIRVELEFEEGQESLSSLPWEFIYFPKKYVLGGGYFLAQQPKVVLTRRLSLKTLRNLRIDKPPLKVLFVASSPNGCPVEYKKVLEVIQDFGSEMIQVTPLLPFKPDNTPWATWPNFIAMLENEEFHAIHFIGHGEWNSEAKQGSILFMKRDGEKDPRADEDVATALMGFKSLRLVFLQACESAQSDPYQAFSGVAQQLAQKGIPAVVGMQYKIQQLVANKFAEEFYKALAGKSTVDEALQRARKKIVEDFSDCLQQMAFGLPVLYLRESDSLFAPAGPPPGQEKPSLSVEFSSCPWCKKLNRITAKFCGNCSQPLACPKCKTPIDQPNKSCTECGRPFDAPVDATRPDMPSEPIEVAKKGVALG